MNVIFVTVIVSVPNMEFSVIALTPACDPLDYRGSAVVAPHELSALFSAGPKTPALNLISRLVSL